MQRLQKDLKQLVSDTKELLGSTADVADKSAKTARARVEASLQTVQDQVSSGMDAVEDKVEEQLRVADKRVRENPYTTMGISFGVGVLPGFIFGRKQDMIERVPELFLQILQNRLELLSLEPQEEKLRVKRRIVTAAVGATLDKDISKT